MKKLVIFGTGDFAAMASKYFERDYHYNIACFTVETRYKNKDKFMGKQVIDYKDIEELYPPDEYAAFVAVAYQKLNRERHRLFIEMKNKGYEFVNYISPYAYVEEGVLIGDNSFVFENNTLQYGVEIGENTIIWSGNHIGHSTKIKNDTYISSHVCISGDCNVGNYCFFGVNSSVADNVSIPDNTLLAMGAALVNQPENEGRILAGVPARELTKSAYEYFGVNKDEI